MGAICASRRQTPIARDSAMPSAAVASGPLHALLALMLAAAAGHGRYKINASYKTWEAARSTCEADGSHLAVLDSEEEMDAVINMLVRCGLEYTRFDFWTGYYRQDESGQWTTVLGWPVGGSDTGFTGWMSGYPNGVRDAACSRLLVTINARGLINGDCTNTGPFVCEKRQ